MSPSPPPLPPPDNLVQSVQDRLVRRARESGEDAMQVLIRYASERLLYRLSVSAHRNAFVLKGALLFTVWENAPHRPTRDVDLLGSGDPSAAALVPVFRDLCALIVPGEGAAAADGLVFLGDTVTARAQRQDEAYQGLHVELTALLGRARIPVRVDVGFGDAVTPAPIEAELPTVLPGFPAPQLRAYPRATVVAEKFEAMVDLGMANSRMKDFYDLWHLARGYAFTGADLAAAIAATFTRRGTALLPGVPTALTAAFHEDAAKKAQWAAFLTRGGLDTHQPLADVAFLLRTFLVPPVEALRTGRAFVGAWPPGGPWGTPIPAPDEE